MNTDPRKYSQKELRRMRRDGPEADHHHIDAELDRRNAGSLREPQWNQNHESIDHQELDYE